MISSFELKRDTMKLVAEKLRRTDEVQDALDRVLFREAVKLLDKEIQ